MTVLEFILNHQDYLEDFITRSTYHSDAIDGSTLTYAETYAILYNDNSFKIEGKEPREIYEAINHKKALENDNISFAEWLKDLSTREKERIEKFGYII